MLEKQKKQVVRYESMSRVWGIRRLDNSFQGGKEMFKTYSWRTASLVMALTAIIGLALPAHGDDGRPFRGHYGHDGTAPGSGQATYLGRFTQEGMVVVDADGSAEGTEVFTAANGDQLFMEVKGAPTDECGPATIEFIPICGTFTVTGGTGRFSDASGEADFMGAITFDEFGPHIAVAFAGTIQY
jgi:hypothetical protein